MFGKEVKKLTGVEMIKKLKKTLSIPSG